MEGKTERRGSLAHVTASGLPSGAPEPLRRAAQRALVREALGAPLGAQLVELRQEAEAVVLVFAGEGWERALAPHAAELARRAGAALGRPGICVRTESCAAGSVPPSAVPADPATALAPGERRERILRAARRLADRGPAADSLTGDPEGSR